MNRVRNPYASAAVLPLVMLMICSANAKGGGGLMSVRAIASSRPIDELPPNIRKIVAGWQSVCGAPVTATRSFVRYLDDAALGLRIISLHDEFLNCTQRRAAFCSRTGCLHQVYVSLGSSYHLAFSEDVPELTLATLDHTPVAEIDCFVGGCRRILRLIGKRLAPR